ncbi:MAG: response regulator transcription factor [Lactobacillus sp.]|jgi:DNA-binding winged helix-turn-helix (wHTH) protein|nr:response regulator transcription factor [Lactobacillus sp.]
MKTILLISENQDFIEDVSEQIAEHIEGFSIVTDCNAPADMVIVDEDTKRLKDFPKLPNILLTSKEIEKGNFHSISKPFALIDLFNDLESIIRRFENTSGGYLTFNNYELRPNTKEIVNLSNNELIKLTEREVSILKYLHKNKSKIVSKNNLLEDVWGYSKDASTHTIETHIYRLRQKVEKGNNAQIIETTDGGYRLIV